MVITSVSDEETLAAAADFVLDVIKKSKQEFLRGAFVVGLSGDLGAGKTAFTKGVARAFGISENITSPTFVIEKIYELPKTVFGAENPFERLIHIDAYRLNGGEELMSLGWRKINENPKNLILIEWPEQVADSIKPTQTLKFTFVDEKTREINFNL